MKRDVCASHVLVCEMGERWCHFTEWAVDVERRMMGDVRFTSRLSELKVPIEKDILECEEPFNFLRKFPIFPLVSPESSLCLISFHIALHASLSCCPELILQACRACSWLVHLIPLLSLSTVTFLTLWVRDHLQLVVTEAQYSGLKM